MSIDQSGTTAALNSGFKGYVYVIENPCMPGLVKVGFSLRDPRMRALELDGTHVPLPFEVAFELLSEEPEKIERATHETLRSHHVGREWFRCSVDAAIAAIRANCVNAVRYEAKIQNAHAMHSSVKQRSSWRQRMGRGSIY